ncbi:MAG: hypothetical protein KUG72_09025 [Pseudomonadales bacterium]|nr:hypothetical protein [Pseudomonadales bacterium]
MHTSKSEAASAVSVYEELCRKIRNAEAPDSPHLIQQFLSEQPRLGLNKAVYRTHLESQFQLLLETLSDEYLPAHWRCQCLDYIYVPLKELHRLVNDKQSEQQVLFLARELRVISHYVKDGLVV